MNLLVCFCLLLVDVWTEIEEPISYISGLSSTIDMMKFILDRVLEEILDTGSAATSSAEYHVLTGEGGDQQTVNRKIG
jgi:hypothetical protein